MDGPFEIHLSHLTSGQAGLQLFENTPKGNCDVTRSYIKGDDLSVNVNEVAVILDRACRQFIQDAENSGFSHHEDVERTRYILQRLAAGN